MLQTCASESSQRRRMCPSSLKDVTPSELLEKVNRKEYNEVTFKCPYCNRRFNSASSQSRHKKNV